MNKKLLSIISILSLSVSFVGCSNSNTTSNQSGENIDNKEYSISLQSMKEVNVGEANTKIDLSEQIKINGNGALLEENKVTINSAGTYEITGDIDEGQIVIDAGDEDEVYIILNGVNITNSKTSPIYSKNCKNLIISLADNSENTLTDGSEYILEENTDEPNATIFSKNDLFITGNGSLNINANYNHAVHSKDELKIQSGNIVVNSKNDGIKGKDCVNITSGNITIVSGGDGIQSSSTEDGRGYVLIEGGNLNIKSGGDGIQAESNLLIKESSIIDIATGEGSENNTSSQAINTQNIPTKNNQTPTGLPKVETPNGQVPPSLPNGESPTGEAPPSLPNGEVPTGEAPPSLPNGEAPTGETPPSLPTGETKTEEVSTQLPKTQNLNTTQASETEENTISQKGIKAGLELVIDGGDITVDSYEDSIHSNNILSINDGQISLKAGDDGIHSDKELNINDGNINIEKSYEGIEGETININGGKTNVASTDDAINATSGNNTNTQTQSSQSDQNNQVKINMNNGYLYLDTTNGDGLDANGEIDMKDGTLIVSGPLGGGNGIIDYDRTFNITGGTFIATGNMEMLQKPDSTSSQNVININLQTQEANTIFNIKSESGEDIITYSPNKQYQSIIVSTPEIKTNENYEINTGGSYEGDEYNGLYSNGTYTNYQKLTTLSISEVITTFNQEGISQTQMNRGFRKNNMKGTRN